MDFEQKLDAVIREIEFVYNLSAGQANLIRQNIISRVNIYKNQTPNFNSNETKMVLNSSNIGDFFINRLVTNIRDYDFDETYNKENTDKGTYTSSKQSIYIGNYKFIEDITREKLERRMSSVDNETLRKATVNVLNHEIGHALQTSFKGKYGINDNKYNQLVERLSTKYPNEFRLQATNEELSAIQQGMIPKRINDQKEQIRSYYSRVSFTTHLDEIFNEDEALKVTGATKPQIKYDMGNGFSKKIYNYQSSNYKITAYAQMMKIVMGEDKTFQSMYEDSIIAYEFFDQFKDLSDKSFVGSTYQGKPPMLNVLNSLDQIRNNKSLEESLKLELFLTECLQKKIAHELKNPNLTQEEINIIKNNINKFTDQMVKNPNVVTKQDAIIENINGMVIEREKQLGSVTNKDTLTSDNHIELMTKISDLKNQVKEIHNDYKKMMADGNLDINELESLINHMTFLLTIVNNLKLENLNENEKNIINQIDSIIIAGQEKMKKIHANHQLKQEESTKN